MNNGKEDLKTTKDKKGWLLPYLMGLDQLFYKRWDYWSKAVLKDKIPIEPIPHIAFAMPMVYSKQLVRKNLKTCLERGAYLQSNIFEKFIDWMLWGFKAAERFPDIDAKTDDFWYRTFNLGLFYKEPADHLAGLATEYNGTTGGYFPTPASIVQMMTAITFGDVPLHEHKKMSVLDPCSGSGIMLMYASNYSLNLFGQDISSFMCKVALVNSYIYVPWLAVRPKHLTMFDKKDGIEEIELPTGIKVSECSSCKGRAFIMELETNHTVITNKGYLKVKSPTLSLDLIERKLKPQNMTCANCLREKEKEASL